MDRKDIKYIVVIQCDHSRKRCSGFACSNTFFEKADTFSGYSADTKFLTMTCGGCCGVPVAGSLEHFAKKLRTKTDIKKSEVAVHLSSCMVTDNHHHDRCPHVDQIKDTIRRHGFENIIEGTYRSKTTSKLREIGKYKVYDSVEFD